MGNRSSQSVDSTNAGVKPASAGLGFGVKERRRNGLLWPRKQYTTRIVRPLNEREQLILPVRPVEYFLGVGPDSSLASLCLHQIGIQLILDLLDDTSGGINTNWSEQLATLPQTLHNALWNHLCRWVFPSISPPTKFRLIDEMTYVEREVMGEHTAQQQWLDIPRRSVGVIFELR
jgi:hypothetical protein